MATFELTHEQWLAVYAAMGQFVADLDDAEEIHGPQRHSATAREVLEAMDATMASAAAH